MAGRICNTYEGNRICIQSLGHKNNRLCVKCKCGEGGNIKRILLRFEVFTAVTMKNDVFWDVTPCGSCTRATQRNIPEDSILLKKILVKYNAQEWPELT
jgi:hypothetical protein